MSAVDGKLAEGWDSGNFGLNLSPKVPPVRTITISGLFEDTVISEEIFQNIKREMGKREMEEQKDKD